MITPSPKKQTLSRAWWSGGVYRPAENVPVRVVGTGTSMGWSEEEEENVEDDDDSQPPSPAVKSPTATAKRGAAARFKCVATASHRVHEISGQEK